MEEGFRSGNICSGTWWNTARINNGSSSSPCSTAVTDHMGISNSYGWSSEMAEIKASSCEETASSVTGSCSSNIVYNQDAHHKSSQESDSVGGGGGVLMDSTLQIMDFVGLSCPTADHWTQALLHGSGGGTAESNFMNRHHHQPQEQQLQKDWSQKNYSGSSGEDSSISNTTSFLQGLIFDPDHPQHQLQEQNQAIQVPVSYENLGSAVNNFRVNSSIPQFLKTSSSSSSSPPKHQLHFPNSTAFWNTSASAMTNNISSGFFPSPSPTQLEEKPNCSILTLKPNRDEVREKKSSSSSSETTFKRPRIETPTPLPTFKVRKEKLGDRITALQQLVSPFGKTDTASVLLEAIEYIKFLHEQVSALSTPYMKSGGPVQYQQNFSDKSKEAEGSKQDLRSRGLCLVPISSTFPVTTETTADIWTPTFGGTYR